MLGKSAELTKKNEELSLKVTQLEEKLAKQPSNPTPTPAPAKEEVIDVNESLAKISAQDDRIKELEAKLGKQDQTAKVAKFATRFENKDVLSKFEDGESSYEDALLSILDSADSYCKNVEESFGKTTPKPAGSVSKDDLEDKSTKIGDPKTRSEAYMKVKTEFELSGEQAQYKAAELYPHLYKEEM